MDTVAFAEYSFAVSIENFINFAVTPVSTTLYNYFCGSVTNQQIKQVRKPGVGIQCIPDNRGLPGQVHTGDLSEQVYCRSRCHFLPVCWSVLFHSGKEYLYQPV